MAAPPRNKTPISYLTQRVTLPQTFRSLRHRSFRLFWTGQLISLAGTWVQDIAQNWLVYRLTGSPAMLGLVNFVGLVPAIPVTLWAGTLADRLNKRKLVLWSQVAMTAQAAILAALTLAGVVQVWHVMVLAFLFGVARAVDMPSRQAFVVEMVGKDDLTNAIALNSTIFNVARMAGPAAAGILIIAVGEGWAFAVNAASFIPVIIALAIMKTPAVRHAVNGRPHEQIIEGLHYARTHTVIWVILALIGVSAFFVMPYSVLMPAFAKVILKGDADTYGWLMTCVGGGALAGALVVASLGPKSRRGALLTVGNITFPALVLVFAFVRRFDLAAGLLVVSGFFFVMQNSLANTLLQLEVPDRLRGRVMSIYFLVFMAAMRLGALQAGFVAHWLSVPAAIALGGGAALLFGAVVAWRVPALRKAI